MSTTHGAAHWLYLAEARYFAWLCGQPRDQQCYWATEVDIMQRFLRETAMLTLNPALDPIISRPMYEKYIEPLSDTRRNDVFFI